MKRFYSLFLILFLVCFKSPAQNSKPPEIMGESIPELVLVYTKTEGYRHENIPKGVQALRELGRENGFIVLQTETSEDFNTENLKNYRLVIFLSTTGDVLNTAEQRAFENYIRNGGAFMGIHAASDTEYDWPWYGKLVGGYFESHPAGTPTARMDVIDKSHPSTAHLPDVWQRTDEWYNFKNLNPDVTVLLNLDESSYEGGTNGENHPFAWYHEYDGGRSFFTGGGHTKACFDEPAFRQHLLGAMEWCLGRK